MNLKLISWLVAFSIAMALLESAVVVYLRALYYPDGFTVALKLIDETIILTELLRELATLVMLLAIAVIAGKKRIEQFAYFLLCFAVWDLFYYFWLKVLIDWPESLFTWDILFLIPITWLGPVIAPVICSLLKILLAYILLRYNVSNIGATQWALLVMGSAIILFTFIVDYGKIMFAHDLWASYRTLLQNPVFIRETSNYIPKEYLWEIFILGLGHIVLSLYITYKKNKNSYQ